MSDRTETTTGDRVDSLERRLEEAERLLEEHLAVGRGAEQARP